MKKSEINKAIERIKKVQMRNVVNRKQAVDRGDTKSELALSEKIEDCNTILWALKVSEIAADDGTFGSYIMNRFLRVH